jgi:hypothetical protein
MRRFAASLAVVALLLVPVASFADDPILQPPVPHCVVQPHESLPILDLLLLAWSILD